MEPEIAPSLRAWVVLDAALNSCSGLPLLLFPEAILPRLGWTVVDPLTTRLLGAALIAVGITLWRLRGAGALEYRLLLGLQVLWSGAAVLGAGIAIGRGAPPAAFLILAVYLAFFGVWSHHAIRLRQLANAPEDSAADESAPPPQPID